MRERCRGMEPEVMMRVIGHESDFRSNEINEIF